MSRGKTQVQRRRVFYIPGYDPYPPRRYRELYRTESQRQAAISGYQIEQKSDASENGGRVRARIEDVQVMTKIDVLVWHDLVKSSMKSRRKWIYITI